VQKKILEHEKKEEEKKVETVNQSSDSSGRL